MAFSCYLVAFTGTILCSREVNMFGRFVLIPCVLLAMAGCHAKFSHTPAESSSDSPMLVQIDIPPESTKTQADTCDHPVHVRNMDSTDEEEVAIAIMEYADVSLHHPSCYSETDRSHFALQLARAYVREMVEEQPGALTHEMQWKKIRSLFALQPQLPVAKTALELMDLYQSIDSELTRTFVEAYARLSAIEPTKEMAESIRQVKEAIVREALVFTYRHEADQNRELDAVIGAYPYDRVQDRIAFAKSVIDAFDWQGFRAMPRTFLDEVGLNSAGRTEVLVYLVAPNVDEDEDYADALDRRAQTYVNAGYDVTEVNAAAVTDLIESDQFADALAYAHKHYDEGQIGNLETRLMKIMRSRGCYSIMENPDGHKYPLYDFKRGCDDPVDDEESDENE